RAGNPHSFRVPESGWTIIGLPLRLSHRRSSIAAIRQMRKLLFRCGVFCMVVFACAGNIAAQSRRPGSTNSRRVATGIKPAERADVARFRKRVEAALSAAGPDKGTWGVLVTDAVTG